MTIRYFKSGEKDIKIALKDGPEDISVPDFVDGARKRFSYNLETGTLSKQCSKCLKWFHVAQLTKEGDWEDIHDEKEIHLTTGNAYRSDCNDCYQIKRTENAESAEIHPQEVESANSNELSDSEPKKVSVSVYIEDRKYLKICAAYLGTTVVDVLAEIINKDRKARKIDY